MSKTSLKGITLIAILVGCFVILLGTEYFARQIIYHPDAVITVHNDTTDKNTQAYAIGNMQVYIDETYRMEMPLFTNFVKMHGIAYNPNFNALGEDGNTSLSLLKDNEKNNPDPFIMKLKIKNLDASPIYINNQNFMLRTVQGSVYKPNQAWQDVLDKAGFFAGAGDNMEIKPKEEKVLWLVYGTPAAGEDAGDIYQEFVRINYDSNNDAFATKVEFPFNYTADYYVGNTTEISNGVYSNGIFVLLGWFALCGLFYYKKSKTLE